MEEIISEEAPSVTIRLVDTKPSQEYEDILDLSVPDDRIVAIAATLRNKSPGGRVAVFSDDLRPLSKARQVGLEFVEIPEAWRREPEQSDEEKENRRLQEEVAFLRSQEPVLVLQALPGPPVDLIVPSYGALSEAEIDQLMEMAKTKHPIETDFERAKPRLSDIDSQLFPTSLLRAQFQPATDEEIKHYTEVAYPDWLESCRRRFASAHQYLNEAARQTVISFRLENRGTRPAEDLEIIFRASGPIAAMPPPPRRDDEDDEFEDAFSLPEVPSAPQGKWRSFDPLRAFGSPGYDAGSLVRALSQPTDNRREPNAFYYRERPSYFVSEYSLTCEQFRHAGDAWHFEVLIAPTDDLASLDSSNGLLEAVCGASNLSEPVPLKVPVRFSFEVRSTFSCLRELLNRETRAAE